MTATSRQPSDSTTAMSVLYVGSESTAAEVSTAVSRRAEHCRVETATSLGDGLARLKRESFDCVVTEYDLSGGTGIDFLETVRTVHPDLPVIIFTDSGSERVASEAISAGATDYLRQCAGDDQYDLLANRIDNAVSQYRSERAEQQLLELAKHRDCIFFVYSSDWSELLFISDAYEDIWGQSVATLRENPTAFLSSVHPEDRDEVTAAMEAVSGGEQVTIEYRVVTDGETRWIRTRGEPIVDDGTVVRIAGFSDDITDEWVRRERVQRQRETLIELATDDAVASGDFERALRRITETAAAVLDVDRVNIWLSDDDTLSCVENYDRRTDEHTSGTELSVVDEPAYIEALKTHRAIDAADAHADPRTSGLADYLDDHDIGALLDGTLRSEGDAIGVVCHEHVGGPREWTEDEVEFASDVADIVHRALHNRERSEREQELREERERFERLLDTSPVGIAILDADGRIQQANQHIKDILEIKPSEIVGRSHNDREWELIDEDGSPLPDEQTPFERVQQSDEALYNVEHGVRTAAGNERWLSINATPIPITEDDDQHGVLAVVNDITDRHREEQMLKTLHDRTRAMTRTEDRQAIAGIAVETMDELLGLEGTVMYEFDGMDRLVPLAWSAEIEAVVETPPEASHDDGVLWPVFADGEARCAETLEASDVLSDAMPFSSASVLPVGTHGVLLCGTAASTPLSEAERNAAHLVRDNLDAALDMADREQRLWERDQALQRQNEQLEQLNRLNTIIRETTAAIIQSSSRAAIERRTCERIATGEECAFAWFGRLDASGEGIEVTQREKMDPEYAEYLESHEGQTPLHEMVATATREGSVQVARNVLELPSWNAHRRDVLNQGFRSVAVVPVPVDGHVEGVLVIHGATPDRFDDREQTVLAELGDAIGYAIQNVDRVSALETEQRTEIELVISDDRLFSNQIAGAVGVDLTLVGAVAGDDETVRLFLRLADPPKTDIEEQLLDRSVVTGAQLLSSEGETALCLVTVERPQLIRSLEANGGKLRRLAVEDGTTKLTALLTGKTAVRAVVEELQDAYPETELLARRRSDEPIDTRETFRDQILAELTEKQLEALQTALYGGFYEWPRTSTRQELAATRDIASSTFSHHLRAAERKLVSAVLDSV